MKHFLCLMGRLSPISSLYKTKLSAMVAVMSLFMCLITHAQSPEPSGPVSWVKDTVEKHLADTLMIEEVQVNTGYQLIPIERVAGAYQVIDSSVIQRAVGMDLLSRLENNSSILFDKRIPSRPLLQIRGLSTLTGTIAQPLVVLDDFPYEGNINDINPNDVASVTILKDAAAASIWGAKAGNGVIVITTKKAGFNRPLSLEVNMNQSLTFRPDLFKINEVLAPDAIAVEIELYHMGAYTAYMNNVTSRPPLTPVMALLHSQSEGLISEREFESALSELMQNDVRNDFQKFVYRNALHQQYQLSASAGHERLASRISLSVDRNSMSLSGDNANRFTLFQNHTYKLNDRLTIQGGVTYQYHHTTQNSLGGYGDDNYSLGNSLSGGLRRQMPIYGRLADDVGTPLSIDKYRRDFTDTLGAGQLLDWSFIPLDEVRNSNRFNKSNGLIIDGNVSYRILPGLTGGVKYRYQRLLNNTVNEQPLTNFSTRELINLYTNLEAQSETEKYPVPVGGILRSGYLTTGSHNLRTQLHYQRTFDKHWLNVLAGWEIREINTKNSTHLDYGYNDRLNIRNVDLVNPYPRILGWPQPIPAGASHSEYMDRFVSFFGNASYSFLQRYTLHASARNDASNLFGVNWKNKWSPLWSIGGVWDAKEEAFLNLEKLSAMRLRVTYGYQGNVNNSLSAYPLIRYLSANFNAPIFLPLGSLSLPGNPELRWEKVRQTNIAMDIASRDNRIAASFDYYWKKSTDVLAPEPMDPTTGYGSVTRNSAHITGRGMELSLRGEFIALPDFSWSALGQFNLANYKVTRYLNPRNTDGFVSDGGAIFPIEGYHPNLVASYKWAGLDPANGDPLGYLNGVPTNAWDSLYYYSPIENQVLHGPAIPTTFGNLLNTVRWKTLSVSFNITFKMGHYFRKPTIRYAALFSSGALHPDYLDRWEKPGDEVYTDVPSLRYPNPSQLRDDFYTMASINALKGDHVRLNDFRIDYRRNSLRLFLLYSNLNIVLWRSNNADLDPEYPTGHTPPRTISAGVSFDFTKK